ncbi:MAG: T9SS type A sorting domain-containing protein [Candidatus Kapaibacterium sp.]
MQIERFYGHLLLLLLITVALPISLFAQGNVKPDSVQNLSQPGLRNYECCHTFIVSNRSAGSIREFRVRLVSDGGEFIQGQAGSPIDWDIFLSKRSIQWLSSTSQAEIDSNESLTSFSFCVRDTGVYLLAWETWDEDGLRYTDTLTFICSGRTNCDEAFFRPLPSILRCGFDIDLLNENNEQKIVNDFHIRLLTPGFKIDTVGARIPAGWRLDRLDSVSISWKTTDSALSIGDFAENFRIYMQTLGSPSVRLTWWTTNFGTQICRDTVTVLCGLRAPDTLLTRRTTVGTDTCCRDILLINSHQPRSPLKRFTLALNTAKAEIILPRSLPLGWSVDMNSSADTATFTIDTLLMPGDSVIFSGVCFDNDLASSDEVRYNWITEYDDLVVMIGGGTVPCFRDVVFCDTVSALVDSSLTATQRCITLNLGNRNSRRDTIKRFTVRIDNPGTRLRILNATPPLGWSIDKVTADSVTFHRGTVDPGFNKEFVFCLNIDTNARDPLTMTWTTWADNSRPICTESIPLRVDLRLACDSVVMVENDQSIDPLCCFDVTFYNKNGKGLPIDQMNVRVPRIDLIIDTAQASGSWSLASDFFPSIFVDYVGDTLRAGDSVTFSFCVDARASQERPITFDVIWQTYSRGEVICFDTIRVVCEGSPGRCDSVVAVEPTGGANPTCVAQYQVQNLHTPDGPINNVQFTIVEGNANFLSGKGESGAADFDQVSLSPKQVIFRGSTIPSGEVADYFALELEAAEGTEVSIEVCTFEDDTELCCEVKKFTCSTLGVEGEGSKEGTLVQSIIPNPFSGTTQITYHMEHPGGVTLLLLDAEGREVKRYSEGIKKGGTHSIVVEGEDIPSGVYFYLLQAGEERETGRLLLVK